MSVVPTLSPLSSLLRCLECGAALEVESIASRPGYPDLGADGWLRCAGCGERYPVIAGTPRMLDREARGRLHEHYPAAAIDLPDGPSHRRRGPSVRDRTAESFAYEWRQFGELREEWRRNFLDYLQPHSPEFLDGKLVLDVGTGSGRHSVHLAQSGAQTVAVDIGRSIDVARRNLPSSVLTVQADAERLPFDTGTFDFVMSIGVLHHLPDTLGALEAIARFAKPGGNVHVYLYWEPEMAWHRAVLRGVGAARRVTVRLPFGILRLLCYPLAAVLWVTVVCPYRVLRSRRATATLAEALPLRTYADYPFGVLVNDQFDRFSAPIEQRFTKAEVQALLERAGLRQVTVLANHGWVGDGVRPPFGIEARRYQS